MCRFSALVSLLIAGSSLAEANQQKILLEEIQVQYCGTWKSQTDHDCNVKLLEYKQKYEDLVCCLMETSTKKSLWYLIAC
jgi:hypothetical protein